MWETLVYESLKTCRNTLVHAMMEFSPNDRLGHTWTLHLISNCCNRSHSASEAISHPTPWAIHNRLPNRAIPFRTLYSALAGPLASFGAPVWKPFLKRRVTPLRYRMRPVPVVFLRFAFSPQLSEPVLAIFSSSRVTPVPRAVLLDWIEHTLTDLSSRITAWWTCMLLDVEGPATAASAQRMWLVVPFIQY